VSHTAAKFRLRRHQIVICQPRSLTVLTKLLSQLVIVNYRSCVICVTTWIRWLQMPYLSPVVSLHY